MPKDKRFRIGISHGDVNGISYEVILKAFADQRIFDIVTPVLYGSSKVASYHRKTIKGLDINFNPVRKVDEAGNKNLNILNITDEEIRIELGSPSQVSGEMAVKSLDMAMADLMDGKIDALVTAPIDKSAVQSEKFRFSGHTEYLAKKSGAEDHLMLMVGQQMKIGMVTGHLPLSEVASHISQDLVLAKLKVMNHSLVRDFGVSKPRIAVLGLNPHAGDDGLLGKEEKEIIQPAVQKANEDGMLTFGPYPADGFFGSMAYRSFDAVLAMYHDQGLIPFKIMAFEDGVNYTAGLPVIRTSPSHGTGFDIAGKDQASPDSMRHAVYLAKEIFKNRDTYDTLKSGAIGEQKEDKQK